MQSDYQSELEMESQFLVEDYCYDKAQLFFKTELCKNWMTYGFCPYANQCKFAHGTHELKQRAPQNAYFRTRYCEKFFTDWWCPYGVRCNFIHDNRSLKEIKQTSLYYSPLLRNQDLKQCKGYQSRRLQIFKQLETKESQRKITDDLLELKNLQTNKSIISLKENALQEVQNESPTEELPVYHRLLSSITYGQQGKQNIQLSNKIESNRRPDFKESKENNFKDIQSTCCSLDQQESEQDEQQKCLPLQENMYRWSLRSDQEQESNKSLVKQQKSLINIDIPQMVQRSISEKSKGRQ